MYNLQGCISWQIDGWIGLTEILSWYSLSAPYSGLKDFLSLKFLKILILFPSLIAYLDETRTKTHGLTKTVNKHTSCFTI